MTGARGELQGPRRTGRGAEPQPSLRQIETNMAPSSFWRWQRCCAANRSQRPCYGTLNRGRSRYIGQKRRLLRLYHHKHFRWRAFDLRDLRTSNFKSIARRAPAPIDAQTPASRKQLSLLMPRAASRASSADCPPHKYMYTSRCAFVRDTALRRSWTGSGTS